MPKVIQLNEELLTQLFRFDNKSMDEIATIMNVSRQTIMRKVRTLGIKRAYTDKDWLIQQHYDNQLNISEIAKIANCNPDTIAKYMKKNSIQVKVYSKKHQYDYSYFENIDSNNKAYWLGFIVADGGIEISKTDKRSTYRLRILISDKDDYHLNKFASEISPTVEIKYGKTILNGKSFGNCSLSIHSKKIVEDLVRLGVYPNKSSKEQMPNISSQYYPHFIRGHFDGDGCFSYWYSKGDLQQELSFLGSNLLMTQFKNILSDELNVKGSIEKDSVMYKLRFTKFNDVLSIINWMYQDDLFLDRKSQKIDEWKQLRKEKGNSVWHPHINVEDIV